MERHKNGVNTAFVRNQLKICAEHKISFYRDGGDKYNVSAAAKTIAAEFGIDYRTPVFIIHRKGYYGSMFGRAYENMKEYLGLIREAKRLGADFIKLAVSGIMDFASEGKVTGQAISYPELKQVVYIANEEGFSVMAHANGAENIKNALCAGVSSIEHGFWPDKETAELFSQTQTAWVPTRSTVRNLIGTGLFDDGVLMNILEKQKEHLLSAKKLGAKIAAGSDCGAVNVLQGEGTDDEYGELSELGIDPGEGNKFISETFKRR